MANPWFILGVLTLARSTMGFQFQGLSSIGPTLISETAISYTALGVLIGAYLLPGAFISIPGGWLGKRFGDKRVVLVGLAMMTAGGAGLVLSDNYAVMFTGRLVSGIGAVLLNVLVTKMVIDWFAGKRIVTAMGVMLCSWPLGIAIALLTLPLLAEVGGLGLAFTVPVAASALALVLVAVVYSAPKEDPVDSGSHTDSDGKLSSYELWGVILSGCVWCLYNVAFILPISFGPEYLTSTGMGIAAAGAIVSLTSWLIIPALPFGAWFAEHAGRPVSTMVVSFVAIAACLWLIPVTSIHILMFAILGIIFGPAGGLIMALPGQVLREQNRAVGMGIFYTVYYVGMGISPAIAGYLRDISGNPAAPLWLAAIAILAATAALLGFTALVRRNPQAEVSIQPDL
jgi:MFS family permease